MNKKPSERIKEIAEQMVKTHEETCIECNRTHYPPTPFDYQNNALVQYLDEQWKQEQEAIEKLKKDLKPM